MKTRTQPPGFLMRLEPEQRAAVCALLESGTARLEAINALGVGAEVLVIDTYDETGRPWEAVFATVDGAAACVGVRKPRPVNPEADDPGDDLASAPPGRLARIRATIQAIWFLFAK